MTKHGFLLLIFAIITILESLFFGFILAGWSSYLFVVIDLGFYSNLCAKDNFTSTASSNYSKEDTKSCTKQQEQLQLLFTIGIAITVLMVFIWAPLTYRYGTVKPKMLAMLLFNSGLIMLGTATPDIPLVIVPGIVGAGLGGYGILISNIKVSTYIPTGSAIYLSLINGAVDSSGITFRFFKLFHDNGISILYSTITIVVLNIILSGSSVLFHKYWPQSDLNDDVSVRVKETGVKENGLKEIGLKEHGLKEIGLKEIELKEIELKEIGFKEIGLKEHGLKKSKESIETTNGDESNISLRDSVCCPLFYTLTFWYCIPFLVYILYIGIINKRLEDSFPDDVSYYTNILAYINLGGFVSAFLPGFTNEWQIYLFKDKKDEKEKHLMPLVLPLCITSILATLVSSLTFVTSVISLYAEFVVLTVQKSYMFISLMQFSVKAFPVRHGTFIYAVINGLFGAFALTQYGLFRWYNSYPGAAAHVKTLMTVLSVVSLIHPMVVFLTAKGIIPWNTFYKTAMQSKVKEYDIK